MEATITGTSELTISGHIRTIEDHQTIKTKIRELIGNGKDEISIKLPDSVSLMSSVIGTFLKLVYSDGTKITLYVKEEKLYNMLEMLNLVTVFNVKKM